MLRLLIVLAIFTLGFSLTQSAGANPPDCRPVADWSARFEAAHQAVAGSVLTSLTQEETRKFLDVFNSEPPETHLVAKTITTLSAENYPTLLAFSDERITCVVVVLKPDLYEKSLKAARGDGA